MKKGVFNMAGIWNNYPSIKANKINYVPVSSLNSEHYLKTVIAHQISKDCTIGLIKSVRFLSKAIVYNAMIGDAKYDSTRNRK